MKDKNRVTVEQAASELCMTPATLRLMMVSHKINLGDCIRTPGSKRRQYRVYRKLLDEAKRERGYA
jgi:hypothetical protein